MGEREGWETLTETEKERSRDKNKRSLPKRR